MSEYPPPDTGPGVKPVPENGRLPGADLVYSAPLAPPAEPPGVRLAPPQPTRRRSALWIWILVLLVAAAGMYAIFGRRRDREQSADRAEQAPARGKGGRGAFAIPVEATRAARGNIGVYLTGLGTVTPIYTVAVRTRVDGQLVDVRYREGDMVRKGDLLLQIDPRPFEVQLQQAEGQLMRDRAALENARVDLARYETLLTRNAIAEQQVATQRATVAQDEGNVKSDEAQVANAKLNLTYSRITAPITGRAGLRLVDPGNMVHASDANPLVVITQIDPISVIFTIAEDQLPPVLNRTRGGRRLPVDAYDREMDNRIARGTLASIDNQVDQSTGTVRLRAIFENRGNRLFPNQFVNARLLLQEKTGVVLLNSAAIQRSSDQTYVYLVRPDSTVTIRPVTAGVTEGENTEITSGLKAGDQVVMTGVDKLVEGAKINPGGRQRPRGTRPPPGQGPQSQGAGTPAGTGAGPASALPAGSAPQGNRR